MIVRNIPKLFLRLSKTKLRRVGLNPPVVDLSIMQIVSTSQDINHLRARHTIYERIGNKILRLITVEVLMNHYTEKQVLSQFGRNAKKKKISKVIGK